MSIVLDGTAGLTFPSGNTQSNAGILTTGGSISGTLTVSGALTANGGGNVLNIVNNSSGIEVNIASIDDIKKPYGCEIKVLVIYYSKIYEFTVNEIEDIGRVIYELKKTITDK